MDFFLGGVALVSRSTSTPINHIVFFWQNTSCIRKPQFISGGGGVRTPCTLLLDPPLHYQYSWSKGPVICLRKDSTSRIIKLKSMADLDELKRKLASHKTKKQCAIENKTLLAQLPYYNCKVLTSAHPQFNSLIDDNRPSTKLLDSLSSLYDLGVFQLDSLDKDIDPDINLTSTKYAQNIIPHTALRSL